MNPKTVRQILSSYSHYYRALNSPMRARFEERLAGILQFLDFSDSGRGAVTLEMKIVIASAQIQLTMGLHKYLPQSFDNIVVLPSAYCVINHDKPLAGHIDREKRVIYLSWRNVKHGFIVHDDAINVALHEFAHWLELESRIDRFQRSFLCKYEFSGWRKVAKKKLLIIRSGNNEFLKDYGGRNMRELFAVCVEAFFEQSEDFKRNLPHLYRPLCDVLNQDPTRRENPILAE